MSTASDISWPGPAGTFNLRVAAVISRAGQVLVVTVEPILPGLGDAIRHVVLDRADRIPA